MARLAAASGLSRLVLRLGRRRPLSLGHLRLEEVVRIGEGSVIRAKWVTWCESGLLSYERVAAPCGFLTGSRLDSSGDPRVLPAVPPLRRVASVRVANGLELRHSQSARVPKVSRVAPRPAFPSRGGRVFPKRISTPWLHFTWSQRWSFGVVCSF